MAARKHTGAITGNLKPADPFELIRWLARSQNDPRKAVAELVQNSFDAGATHVQVTRARQRGSTTLHILDNGHGVLPDLSREEALAYIATHVGHSRKRNLTPEQRRELMLQGKYGIGLLGFWSIGTHFEMRSQVDGSDPWVLNLTEDLPRFTIERLRGRLSLRGTWTEIVIRQLHRAAFVNLGAKRIADYLASELRGQLLARSVTLTIHDRVARGRAPKTLTVEPIRYSGQPLSLPAEIVTPHGPVRVELYLLPERNSDQGHVGISCAGSIVYDDITTFAWADFTRPPWTEGRLSGVLEFAGFDVAPGTRRGVAANEAAASFATAVTQLEPALLEALQADRVRLASQLEADLMRQLQRAFRDVRKLAPEYDFFAPDTQSASIPGTSEASNEASDPVPASPQEPEGDDGSGAPADSDDASTVNEEPAQLFPPGPLSRVEIHPPRAKVAIASVRRLRARALAADGREIRDGVDFEWTASPGATCIEATGSVTELQAGNEVATVTVDVTATQGGHQASAQSLIEIIESPEGSDPAAAIPKPELIHEPTGNWRSRYSSRTWQVNSGHRDYLIASETPRRKLRYLTALLAKEVVLHTFPHPQHNSVLERMIEVLTITDRRMDR